MGNIMDTMSAIRQEHARILEILKLLQKEMDSFQTRLAGLEKDYGNLELSIKDYREETDKNSRALLNISLLEEGRSTYRPKYTKKYHTSSTYK